MEVGDHLITSRMGYAHHGLYIGSNKVIHYSGFANGPSGGVIEIASLDSFGSGFAVAVKNHLFRVHDGQDAVDRGVGRLGEARYNLLTNNCEHFVYYCIFGVKISPQVANVAVGVVGGVEGLAMAAASQVLRSSVPNLQSGMSKVIDSEIVKVASTVKPSTVAKIVILGPAYAAGSAIWSFFSR